MSNVNIDEENKRIVQMVVDKIKDIATNQKYEFKDRHIPIEFNIVTGEMICVDADIGGDY